VQPVPENSVQTEALPAISLAIANNTTTGTGITHTHLAGLAAQVWAAITPRMVANTELATHSDMVSGCSPKTDFTSRRNGNSSQGVTKTAASKLSKNPATLFPVLGN